jgi:uncharacterized protein with FMN-binding domain
MKKRLLLITFVLLSTIFMLTGCGKSKWNDGEYEGNAEGMHGDLGVNVVIEDGKISKIDIVSEAETEGVSDVAMERVPEDIIDEQSTEVDTVSGATESSKTIIAAVEDALSKAEK